MRTVYTTISIFHFCEYLFTSQKKYTPSSINLLYDAEICIYWTKEIFANSLSLLN